MVCSSHIILTLYGIAVCVIVRRSHARRIRGRGKDMISELPDDVLVSIITRMRMKDSVKTSILSKRWRYLYKFVPVVEFHCSDLMPSPRFIDKFWFIHKFPHETKLKETGAVDTFLMFHAGSNIRSCVFKCCLNKSHTDQFEQWILSLGKLGVEELNLQFRCCNEKQQFSDLSFNCGLISELSSLKYLRLVSCYLPNMATQCISKSLQTLALYCVGLLPDSLECILSNCLSLHTLAIDSCIFNSHSKLFVCGPNLQLKYLYIFSCSDIKEIEFYASNLMKFEFRGFSLASFVFDHVPQLQTIFLYVYYRNILPYVRGELARDLPQLKSLAFTTRLSEIMYGTSMRINTFNNLRKLYFSLYGTRDADLLCLIPFLHSCPLLQELHLDASCLNYIGLYNSGTLHVNQEIVVHKELKKVEISGFSGAQNELEFALCILKSAVRLELMHITRRQKCYTGYGFWSCRDRVPWWEDIVPWWAWTHERINLELQGQALSKTARVVYSI